jgi:hypothetical protein
VRTLTVTGHGTATAVPDTAVVRVAAVHQAPTLAEALSGAESARAAVVAAASDLVVSTTNLSVWPAHDAQGQQSGFEARHSLSVATGSLDRASDLLGRLAAEVGDRLTVEGVQLTVSDPTAALGAAREAAYADARARAEHLAALADDAIGQVVAMAEGTGAATPGRELAFAKVADVGLQPGETTLSTAVTVTWELA